MQFSNLIVGRGGLELSIIISRLKRPYEIWDLSHVMFKLFSPHLSADVVAGSQQCSFDF